MQLAGFELKVVKTTSAGHARKLAADVDFTTCPDGKIWFCVLQQLSTPIILLLLTLSPGFSLLAGIICVGGDGIINEVYTVTIFSLPICIPLD